MACLENKTIDIPECVVDIKVNAGLTPATEFYYALTTDANKVYTRLATTDADGALTISASLFPEGFFNAGRGFYTFMVFEETNSCNAQDFTICGQTIDQLIMKCKVINPVPEIFEIG